MPNQRTAEMPSLRLKAEVIRAAMQRRDIRSQEVLAVRLGLSRSTVFRAMSGEQPSPRLIAALSLHFGLSIDDLVEAVPSQGSAA